MRACLGLKAFLLKTCLLLLAVAIFATDRANAQSSLNPGYAAQDAKYSPSARAGREIWFFATAFNDRFYTYSYPQRLGGAIDWYRDSRPPRTKRDLFQGWGAIPDPDCCIPGDPNCPARSLEETYGFQYCPGDDGASEVRRQVRLSRSRLRFQGCAVRRLDAARRVDQRQRSLRPAVRHLDRRARACANFPIPASTRRNGASSTARSRSWDAYAQVHGRARTAAATPAPTACSTDRSSRRSASACPAAPATSPTSRAEAPGRSQQSEMGEHRRAGRQSVQPRLADARLGHVAASARVAADRARAPRRRRHFRAADGHGVQSRHNERHRQFRAAARTYDQRVLKWRKASQCPGGTAGNVLVRASRSPANAGSAANSIEAVQNILKGGEDTIGAAEAIQRVYFNIGSCAEQCWLNHVPDLRAIDPSQRNYGQTPFDIGQCRRDCASFRAIEDRLRTSSISS